MNSDLMWSNTSLGDELWPSSQSRPGLTACGWRHVHVFCPWQWALASAKLGFTLNGREIQHIQPTKYNQCSFHAVITCPGRPQLLFRLRSSTTCCKSVASASSETDLAGGSKFIPRKWTTSNKINISQNPPTPADSKARGSKASASEKEYA